jgi:RNA polymerase sigma factor (sigma-70 family)
MDDRNLLQDYVKCRSEAAFQQLVERHLPMVYSAAHRMVRDSELARDVAQSVFTTLMQKAHTIRPPQVLGGWLYNTTRHLAMNTVRAEQRRRNREQTAFAMQSLDIPSDTPDLREFLEPALADLDDADRSAIVLRFFENRSLREVGTELGISEDAARKRVDRALERLRLGLKRQDVVITTALLGPALVATTMAIPSTLVRTISSVALAAVPIAAPSLMTTILALLAKVKLATVALALLFAGIAVLVSLRFRDESLRGTFGPVNNTGPIAGAAQNLQPAANRTAAPGSFRAVANARPTDPSLDAAVSAARKFYERAIRLHSEQKYDEAVIEYSRAIELIEQGLPVKRWFYDAYFGRASLAGSQQVEAKRNYAQALDDYTKALAMFPNEYSARANRGLTYTQLKRYGEAIADLTKIIEDPEVDFSHFTGGRTNGIAWAYEYRGQAYQAAKDYNRAIADYADALRWSRGTSEEITIQWRTGLCYNSLGQPDKAVEVADALSQRALRWATNAEPQNRERDRARTAARFASELMGHKRPYQLEVLAAVAAKAGEFATAESYQQRALNALPPAAESQREAVQARLELYRARKPLRTE